MLCAETNPLLVVDKDGHATGTIRLRNRGPEPLTLQLFVSEFKTAGDGAPDNLDAATTLSVADAMTKAVVRRRRAASAEGGVRRHHQRDQPLATRTVRGEPDERNREGD